MVRNGSIRGLFQPPLSTPVVLGVFVAFVVVLVTAGTLVFGFFRFISMADALDGEITSYFASLESGQFSDAHAMMCRRWREVPTEDLEMQYRRLGVESFTGDQRATGPMSFLPWRQGRGQAGVFLEFSDGRRETLYFPFTREAGGWRVCPDGETLLP